MAGAAEQGITLMQYSVYDGSITGHNTEIQRRPYHRNCGCALHRSRGTCAHSSTSPCSTITYPVRRSWSEGSLVLAASISSPSLTLPCSCTSPSSSCSDLLSITDHLSSPN